MRKKEYSVIIVLVLKMKTIEKTYCSEIEIKKSRFIGILLPIHSLDEIQEKRKEIEEQYPGATHYCYAYILDQEKRCSDDKEPSKTAGMPILNVLEHQELNHVLCVIVRYFGGIKLGAGGLVRAYTAAAVEVMKEVTPIDLIPGISFQIHVSYEEQKQMDYLLKEFIQKKEYSNVVTYEIECPNEFFEQLDSSFKDKIENKKDILVRKKSID